ncbi:MAG: DUF1254 domain-containing protein [Clostridia bacterium]|nr:DUF1254 domain-containing protein [Clostridia bacterium]
MKKIRKAFSLILCLSLMLGTFGCAKTENHVTLTEEEKAALLEKAYIFTLPLMMTDATVTAATNTVEVTNTKAPANRFIHAEALATAEFKNVVTPNVDTIYSQMMLDLSEDAVIIELPKTERFCTAQLLDAYTNCVDVIDASKFENESEKFIFTGVDFDGEIPEGMKQIKYPTSMGWIIVRTICFDKADEANVHAIQNTMKTYTLSQLESGKTDEYPDGTYDEKNDFVPSEHVMTLSMQEYFERANALMAKNPPTDADAPMMEEIAKINVGPDLEFDSSVFGENSAEIWKSLVSGVVETTQNQSLKFFTKNGNWSYMGKPIAEFGTEYAYRAFIALFGLGANPVSVAVYPKTDVDSDGNRLNGNSKYVLHFEKDELPPVEGNGFWSVTAYDSSNNFLIDNKIDRYCINDRSDVVYNEDGSLDIYIQAEKPEENGSNWLPVIQGEFHLVLRIYMPDETVVNNEWQTPILKAVK